MGQPLEVHIRKLQEFYWSDGDPDGRGFVPLADALRRAGDLREAHRLLRDGLNRHPDYLSGQVVAAWLCLDRGRLGEAEDRFRTALELDPRNVVALRGLADLLLDNDQQDEALPFLETLIHEEPFDEDLPAQISALRAEVESPREDASLGSEEASPVWPDSDEAAGELNWEVATLQKDISQPLPEDAPSQEEGIRPESSRGEKKERPSSVVEDGEPIPSPEDMEEALVTSTLGEIYLRQGLFDRAEAVFEQLLEEDPGNEHIRHRLEETRELMGFREETGSDWEAEARESMAADGDEEAAISVELLAPDDTREPDDLPFPVVPIESLIPDGVGMGLARPVSTGTPAPEEVVSVEALAPETVVSVDDLAPDGAAPAEALLSQGTLSIDALAPDEPVGIGDLAPEEVLSVEDLAPEGALAIEALEPEGVISVEALAPDAVVSVDALAPDTSSEGGSESDVERGDDGDSADSSGDAFERWLENLQ